MAKSSLTRLDSFKIVVAAKELLEFVWMGVSNSPSIFQKNLFRFSEALPF
jgi:hypothetical protein